LSLRGRGWEKPLRGAQRNERVHKKGPAKVFQAAIGKSRGKKAKKK